MMCASIKDFYNNNKYAILWTVGYVIATWAIMRYMFNFNIFSAYRWHQLMHAHLHGFAGFVFGILILAMVPLYLATTIVIARTKSPLFNFNLTVPEFIKRAFIQTPMDEPKTESEQQIEAQPESTAVPEPEQKTETTPENIPAELRVAYERARGNISRTPVSAYDLGNVTKKNTPVAVPEPVMVATNGDASELPIPTDFDINDTSKIVDDVPVFSDLNFDDDDIDVTEVDETPTPDYSDQIQTTTDTSDIVTKYLTAKSVPHQLVDDVVVTDRFAIVSHTDPDFWVADTESWFAAGKIRKSPIVSVMDVAAARGLQPVLYLGADNIMDINDLRTNWESSGIRIITDLKDLM